MKSLTKNISAMIEKLGKLEDLEEQIGCPLEVRCKVVTNSTIYGCCLCTPMTVYHIDDTYFRCTTEHDLHYVFPWNEYKISWWLRKDKSE